MQKISELRKFIPYKITDKMEIKDEVFVPVNGFENRFRISNYGTLISIGGFGQSGKKEGERVVKGSIDVAGYRSVTLRAIGKKRWCVRIHTLVALHFVENGKPGEYDTVNHMDGNKLNNYAGNLEWCTGGMNTAHAFRIGLINHKGERSPMSKLKTDEVIKIRRLYESGHVQSKIAAIFGISRRHVSDIVNRVCWAHI